MRKRLISAVVACVLLLNAMPLMLLNSSAAWILEYSPNPNIESGYSSGVSCGTIRYISQIKGSTYFYSSYWPSSSFGGYSSPGSECGTASISMALSYVGINKTPKTILEANNGYTYFTGWGPSTSSPSVADGMNNYINGKGKYSPVIIHLPKYSSAGHWVVLVGKVSNNVYHVLDPATEVLWNITVNGTSATYSKNGATIYDTIDRTYQYYNANAVLETAEKYRPGKPALTGMQSTYTEGTSITFKWSATDNTTHYNLYIHKKNSDGQYGSYEDIHYANNGTVRTLPVGEYRIFVQSTNSNYWESDGSTWLYCNSDFVYLSVLHNHSYNYKTTKNPTVSATGTLTGTCSKCSGTTTVTLPKLNTTDYTKTTTKAPTCTATGTDSYKWKTTTYGTFAFTVTTAAKGHTPVTDKAVDATCTIAGKTEGSHCSVCNAVIKAQTTIPATGHSYTSKVTTAATCTNVGVKTFTCAKCSHSYTEAIAATGHTPVADKAVAATCTTAGKTEGSHCSVCNAVIKAQTTVAALGHSYTSQVTAPTCTEQGYITHTCSRCSNSYKDSYTAATGHSYNYTDRGDTHEAVCTECFHSVNEAHSYTDNICVCGAKEVLAPITDENIVINHSLNLASDISINYAVNAGLLSGYDNFHLEIQVPIYNGDVLTGFKNVTIDPAVNGSYYYFTMTEVTAVNMNDILVATLHMNKGKQEYVSKPDSYSIVTYALNQLNKDGAAQKLKALCADLLRYGASAQMFKGYRTDALATASMTAAHEGYLSNLNTVTFGNTNTVYNDLTNPMITWAGKTLNLGSKVVVKFVFNAGVYTGNISNLTLRMIYRDNSGAYRTVTLTNPTVYSEANRQYAFEFDGLMAAELRTPLSVAVYNEDTQLSQTLQYSPDTYGNNKTGALGDLCKALFAYSDSAKKYFS